MGFEGSITEGSHRVGGGAEDEAMHLLDFTPFAVAPSREFFSPEAVAADLDRLAAQQRPDGGWEASFDAWSPAAAREWRGHATVAAVSALREADR